MAPLDDLPLSKLMKCDSTYPCCSVPYRSAQQLKALAERTMLTLFIGEDVNYEKLRGSEIIYTGYIDKLTTCDTEEKMVKHTGYEVEKLDEKMINWLVTSLPGITSVRFFIGEKTSLGGIIQLLEQWANQLETLRIWSESKLEGAMDTLGQYNEFLGPVFSLLNEKATSLQYFAMYIPLALSCIDISPLEVSFIGRLKLFSTNLPNVQVLGSLGLSHHAGALQGESLPEIRLFNTSFPTSQAIALEVPTSVASQISAICLHSNEPPGMSVFAHFPGLKWYKQYSALDGAIPLLKIPAFLDSLSVLSQLKFLEVQTDLCELATVNYRVTPQVETLLPLPSLEVLSILVFLSKQPIVRFFAPFDRRFPSLKWLQMTVFIPSGTDYSLKETVSAFMRQFAQNQLCGDFRLLLSAPSFTSLKKCTILYEEVFSFAEGAPSRMGTSRRRRSKRS